MSTEVSSLVLKVDGREAVVSLDQVAASFNATGAAGEKMGKSTESGMESASKSIAGLVSALGIGAAAWKAYSIAVEGVKKAQADVLAQAKLEGVIRATGTASGVTSDQMERLNKVLSENSIYSTGTLKSAQALMATFSEVSSDVFPDAMQAAVDLSNITGSLEGAVTMLGKALQNPEEGLGALSRVGYTFTDQQKEMIKTLTASGKTMEAQTFILKELNKYQGGVAKTVAESAAGQLIILKNQYDDIQSSLGEKLLPTLVQFQKVMNAVMAAFNGAVDIFNKTSTATKVAVGGFAAILAGALVTIPAIIALAKAKAELNKQLIAFAANSPKMVAGLKSIASAAGAIGIAAIAIEAAASAYEKAMEKKTMDLDTEAAQKSLNALKPRMDGVITKWQVMDAEMKKNNDTSTKSKEELDKLAESAVKAAALIENMTRRTKGLSEMTAEEIDKMRSEQFGLKTSAQLREEAAAKLAAEAAAKDKAAKASEEYVKRMRSEAEALKNEVATAVDKFIESVDKIGKLKAGNFIDVDTELKAIDKITDEYMKGYQSQTEILAVELQSRMQMTEAFRQKGLIGEKTANENKAKDLKRFTDTVAGEYRSQTDIIQEQFEERQKSFDTMINAGNIALQKSIAAQNAAQEKLKTGGASMPEAQTAEYSGQIAAAQDDIDKQIKLVQEFQGYKVKLEQDTQNKLREIREAALAPIASEQDKILAAYELTNRAIDEAAATQGADLAKVAAARSRNDYEYAMAMQELSVKEKAEADKRAGIRQSETDVIKAEYGKRITETVAYYTHIEKDARKAADAEKALIAERDRAIQMSQAQALAKIPGMYDAQIAVVRAKLAEELALHAGNTEAIIALKRNAAQQIAAIEAEAWQQPLQGALQYADAAMTVVNAVTDAYRNANDRKLSDIDKTTQKEIDAVKKSGATKRVQEAEIAAIEQEAAKKKLDIAVSQWNMDKAMAVVNASLAALKALASAPPPLNYVLAAATAAAGAIQVGIINSNKPTMAQGGFVPGTSYTGDRVPIQVNSGEAVLNAAQQRNFMALANGAQPRVRGPAQLSSDDDTGIGAMQPRDDAAPSAPVEQTTVMTANFYDSRLNVTEEIRAAIRSGEFIPVMREALQAVGA